MTSDPPYGGGDPRRGPGDQGQPYGSSPSGQPQPGQEPQQGQYPGQYPQQGQYPGQYPQQGQYPGQYPQQGQYPGQYPQYPQPGYGQDPYAGGQPQYAAYPGGGAPLPPVSPDPLVPFSFGDWFTKVFATVARSWQPLALVQLAYLVPVAVLGIVFALLGTQVGQNALDGSGTPSTGLLAGFGATGIVFFLVYLALYSMAQVAAVYVLVRDASGRPYAPGDVWRFALTRMLPMIGWGLLAGILIVIGTVLLLLPGLYLGVVFVSSLAGVVAIERADFTRCFTLAHNYFLPVVGRMLLLLVAVIAASLVLGLISGLLSFGSPIVSQVLSTVLGLPVAIVTAAAAMVTYAELRFREHGGVHTAQLANEMERP